MPFLRRFKNLEMNRRPKYRERTAVHMELMSDFVPHTKIPFASRMGDALSVLFGQGCLICFNFVHFNR